MPAPDPCQTLRIVLTLALTLLLADTCHYLYQVHIRHVEAASKGTRR